MDTTAPTATRRPIRPLDPRVVEQIAAGEVIERPASVVKELLENAIDAGARTITVELRGGGLRAIRVSDDGAGIPADELDVAFARHATSKLRDAGDLWRIASLGFRGEALASIGATAEVLLISATGDDGGGAGVLVEDGRVVERFSRARARGATVTARNLFAHQPARLKFMRGARAESAQVSTLVRRYALAYPERRLRLVLDGHVSFESPGTGRLADALAAVYGREIARLLLPLEPREVGGARVGGVISGSQLHRPSRRYVAFFVNRRAAVPHGLGDALEAAYRPYFPRGRHPLAALFLDLPPDAVDVNVHPAKAEVKLLDAAAVAAALGEAVRETLARNHVPRHTFDLALRDLRALAPAGGRLAEAPAPWDGAAPVAPEEPIAGPNLPPLRLLGQLRNALLVAEGPEGLYLIDQHRAHERIIYERLLRRERGEAREREVIEPLVLELGPLQAALLDERLPELEDLGIRCEYFGGRSFLVRELPAIGEHEDLTAALPDLFDELVEDDEGWRERLLVNLSCRAALRKGRPLDPAQQRDLLRALAHTATPATCPHG
ncbi:MAG TPA: DNA mismatch repair endonuclease MutL, partial [Thermomicrobiales bacterium]|nr:DNA mismatch repair endonuclease MutL [Thermomicrobiales bacterium]